MPRGRRQADHALVGTTDFMPMAFAGNSIEFPDLKEAENDDCGRKVCAAFGECTRC